MIASPTILIKYGQFGTCQCLFRFSFYIVVVLLRISVRLKGIDCDGHAPVGVLYINGSNIVQMPVPRSSVLVLLPFYCTGPKIPAGVQTASRGLVLAHCRYLDFDVAKSCRHLSILVATF